jgi:arylformamidase
MFIRLSYDFSEHTPYPQGLWPVRIEHQHDMAQGRISNVYTLTLCNHVGTHIDGPRHFSRAKRPLNEFPLESFIFTRPVVLDLLKGDDELVTTADLEKHRAIIQSADLLLIRTGFGRWRRIDIQRYTQHSPGFSAAAARYCLDHLPNLRAVGMDSLSFAAPQQLAEGITAHQILMDQTPRDIFLIEDMKLDEDLTHLQRVMVAPLFCAHIDSSPCTVLAEID